MGFREDIEPSAFESSRRTRRLPEDALMAEIDVDGDGELLGFTVEGLGLLKKSA